MKRLLSVAFIAPAVLATSDASVSAADLRFYVGTYTKKWGSKGIYLFRMNSESGALTAGGLVAEARNPTFLALHPNRRLLYSVNEIEGSGGVSAYAIGADNGLAPLNSRPSGGAEPCHLAVDGAGKYVLVANYGGGSVAALPIHDDGTLGEATGFGQHTGSGPNARRQERPHAHSIYSQGGFVYACDLGTDQVLIYRLDAQKGTLTPSDPRLAQVAAGSGPRHLAFRDGFAYVINEMLNTITVFEHDAITGALEQVQDVTTLPEGFAGQNTTAEILVHPNGRFLYGSNRGHDSIAVFAIGAGGRLTFVEHTSTQGRGPRNFALDLSGRWLLAANQETSNIVVFKVDAASGRLTPAGQTAELGSPACVTFGP